MVGLRLLGLHLPVHVPPAPHDLLHVGRRPRPPHRQQRRLGLRRRHPRQRPDLGVGQLPARQGRREPRQPAQRPGDPHALPGRAQVQSRAPAQPLGAGAGAALPAAAGVELAEQVQQPGGGGVEVGRELGDLVAETVQLCDARMRRHEHGNLDEFSMPGLYHSNFEAPGSAQDGAGERGNRFRLGAGQSHRRELARLARQDWSAGRRLARTFGHEPRQAKNAWSRVRAAVGVLVCARTAPHHLTVAPGGRIFRVNLTPTKGSPPWRP